MLMLYFSITSYSMRSIPSGCCLRVESSCVNFGLQKLNVLFTIRRLSEWIQRDKKTKWKNVTENLSSNFYTKMIEVIIIKWNISNGLMNLLLMCCYSPTPTTNTFYIHVCMHFFEHFNRNRSTQIKFKI